MSARARRNTAATPRAGRMRPFSLINRYVFRELSIPALLGLIAFTAIFVVERFFFLAEQWVAGVLEMQDVALSLVYFVPSTLVQTIPMAVLLGVLIGFSRMSSDSEITALRATGVSYYSLLVPSGMLAVIGCVLAAAVYLYTVPWANTQYQDLHLKASRRADVNRGVTPGTWVYLDGAALFARGVDASDPAEPWLLNVDVVFSTPGKEHRERWRAGRARVERLLAEDGTGRLKIEARDLSTFAWTPGDPAAAPIIAHHDSRTWVGEEKPMGGAVREAPVARRIHVDARLKGLPELRETLRQLAEMDRIDAELEPADPRVAAAARDALGAAWVVPQRRPVLRRITIMEVHKKFSIPLACLVFALCGLPLGVATRRGGWQAAFVVAIAVVILWYFVYRWADAFMKAGQLSPALSAWLPDITLATIGLYLLFRQRRQQRVGVYRIVRDVLFLGTLTCGVLTALLLIDRLVVQGAELSKFPMAPPIVGAACLVGAILVIAFRDVVARSLASLTEGIRRHGARQAPLDGGPLAPPTHDELAPPLHPGPHADLPRTGVRRLEDVRSGLVYVLLAVLGVAAFDVVSDEGGLIAGARGLATGWLGLLVAVILLGFVGLQLAGVRIMKTLDWWILTAYVKTFALILAALVLLAFVFQYLGLAEAIIQNGVGVATVGRLYLNSLPEMLVQVVPMAAMVGALVCLGLVAKNNESTAVRCGGVSLFRLAVPVVLTALALSFGTFLLHDYVMPKASMEAYHLREEIRGRPTTRRGPSRGFVLADNGRTLYVLDRASSAPDGANTQLHGLNVLRFDDAGEVRDLAVAKVARWTGSAWMLHQGWRAEVHPDGVVERAAFDRWRATDLVGPDYFTSGPNEPDQMSFGQFRRHVQEQSAAGYPVSRLRVQLQRKLAFPVASLVLVLVGLPFALTAGRHGALYGIGLSFVLYILYYAATAVFAALGSAAYIPPTVAAWAPNVLFLLGGAYLLLHVRT